MEIAITIDELLLWDGTPMPRGYTPHTVLDGLLDALAQHDVTGVYAFAHTSPVEDDPALRAVLERWCEAGHHLGNHTHCHANLNWLTADRYCDDIRVAETFIGDLVDQAPTKYFRHAMDMSGRSEAKRGAVQDRLRDDGYTTAPITAWFGDFAWTAPYARALDAGDQDAVSLLRTSYVEAAVGQLHAHAEAARRMFGSDLPCIWLIHGTSLAQDLLGEILRRFTVEGVRFVSLEQAMKHPVHRASRRSAATSATTCSATRRPPGTAWRSRRPISRCRSSPRCCPPARTRWPATTTSSGAWSPGPAEPWTGPGNEGA